MKRVFSLVLALALLVLTSAFAEEWLLFPDGVTWSSSPGEICELNRLSIGRMRCFETFQTLTREGADIPAMEGGYPDVSYFLAAGEMIVAAWKVYECDSITALWDGLYAVSRSFAAADPAIVVEGKD